MRANETNELRDSEKRHRTQQLEEIARRLSPQLTDEQLEEGDGAAPSAVGCTDG